ncbi:hypothetical protein D3C78_1031980 [compost metagenome]
MALAQVAQPTAGEIELAQLDDGLLPQLERDQAEIQIERQIAGRHLIEHRVDVVLIAQLAKLPEQLLDEGGLADGIPHHYPAIALDPIHQKRLATGVKQQRFVAELRQIAVATPLPPHQCLRPGQFLLVRLVAGDPQGSQQLRYPDHGQHGDHAAHGAQATGGGAMGREVEPEAVVIRHLAIGEQQQPQRPQQHGAHRQEPTRGELGM